jgi:hypothetical protein
LILSCFLVVNPSKDGGSSLKMPRGLGAGAHACNPSYSEGTDQEDRGSQPAWADSSARPYLEKPFTKIGLVEWLKVKALSSSPSTEKKA